MDDLNDKVAVVTGGASGIGLAMGRAFAAEGMRLVLADIEGDTLDAAVVGFGDGAEVIGVRCDVSDATQVDALRDAAVERFGAVHVVCNNAGVSAGGAIWETSLDDWEWVLGVNLMGVVHGIRAFAPLFIEQGEGHIVNTASMAGLISPPFMAIYNVSKHAVVTMTETLFADLQLAGATGVGASVLCPGWVKTRIHEAGRNRPEGSGGDVAVGLAGEGMQEYISEVIASGLDPAVVADQVVQAVRERQFYVLTHPAWNEGITRRTELIVQGADPQAASLPT